MTRRKSFSLPNVSVKITTVSNCLYSKRYKLSKGGHELTFSALLEKGTWAGDPQRNLVSLRGQIVGV